jgi:hypothetical protein
LSPWLDAPYKSGIEGLAENQKSESTSSYTVNRGNVLSPTQMILYHITSSENAAAIKRDGCDTGGSYMTESEHRGVEHRGVWLFDRPLDANEGAWEDTAIAVDLPLSEADLDQYEWKEEGKVYREWLIPAAIINKYWWPK